MKLRKFVGKTNSQKQAQIINVATPTTAAKANSPRLIPK